MTVAVALALALAAFAAFFAAIFASASASAQVNFSALQAPDPGSWASSVAAAPPAAAYPSTASTPASPTYADGEAIVRFKPGTSPSTQRRIHRALGTRVKRKLLLRDTFLVKFNRHLNPRRVADAYKRRPGVKYAEPNFIRTYDSTFPNDPNFGELWGMHNKGQTVNGAPGTAGADIAAPEAWQTSQGSSSVAVGVVDTGVDYNHSDLAPNIWSNPGETPGNSIDDDGNGVVDDTKGYDFLDGDNDPLDTVGHGSHVAGIVAGRGNNGIGVTGVSWRSQIVPMRACDSVGCDDAAIADAFTYAGRTGIKIVNASLSGSSDPTTPGTVYSNTVSAAISASPNTLFVVSSGNGGGDEVGDNVDVEPQYPCSYTAANILCVASSDSNDQLSTFSNYGATSVDLAAPGQYILSTWIRNGGQDQYAYQSGTSQSTAMVAGAAALDLSNKPALTTAQIKSDLTDNAFLGSSFTGKVSSDGRLSLRNVVPHTPTPYQPPGGLDPAFDADGKVTTDFSGNNQDQAEAVAVQSDGKIVALGTRPLGAPTPKMDLAIARYNSNGALDTGFDTDGKATITFNASANYGHDVAIQPDGKIVVVGEDSASFAIARLNANGSLDTSFDGDGKATVDFGTGNDQALGVALQTDGKIVVAGVTGAANPAFAIARLNTNGGLDTGFDGDGKATVDFSVNGDTARDVAIQPDGKIVVGGGQTAMGNTADFAVARLNTNGSLDTSFDGDGKATAGLPSTGDDAYGLALEASGSIVLSGRTTTGTHQFEVARLLSSGALDTSFDSDGFNTASFTGGGDGIGDVVIDPSTGKIVVSGIAGGLGAQASDYALATYRPNGQLDSQFGSGGTVRTDFNGALDGALNFGPGIALQSDGLIVVAGMAQRTSFGKGDFALLRYFPSRPTLYINPNAELNPAGDFVGGTGDNFAPSISMNVQQCAAVCSTIGTVGTDSNGHFSYGGEGEGAVSYNTPAGGCPDPNCRIVVTPAGSDPVSVPISFADTTSIAALPSRGAVLLGNAVKVGDLVTASAVVTGDSGNGTPTGSVSFSWCGPIVSPATCVQGGTGLGTQSLAPAGSNSATATSAAVSFPAAGRYCFRAVYNGDTTHRAASDSSKAPCVAVRATPGTGPVALDDSYQGAPGDTIADGTPGLMQNDLFGAGQSPTAQLVTPPSNGTLQGGLNADGSFTYVPDGNVKRISTGPTGDNGATDSEFAVASDDGTHVFFTTTQPLVAGDTDTSRDLYERVGSTTTLVSIGPAGGNGAVDVPTPSQGRPAVSPDGAHVFFKTDESLVAADTDTWADLYERFAGTTTLVSTGPASTSANGYTPYVEAVSANGARVLFSTSERLVAADTDGNNDVYERFAGSPSLISTGPTENPSNPGGSITYNGSSADGTRVFFTSNDRLVASDTNSYVDVYERSGGATTMISSGNPSSGSLYDGNSADGSRVFIETFEALVPGDTDGRNDIYERSGGTSTLVSTGPAGGNGAFDPTFRGLSANGSHVFFTTDESLVAGDADTARDIYDRSGGTTTLVSVGDTTGAIFYATSADGTRVIFGSRDHLVPGDTDNTVDIYERVGGTTNELSIGPSGGNDPSVNSLTFRGISDDATHVYFTDSERLAPPDGDSSDDVYERSGGATTLISTGPGDTNFTFQANIFDGNSADGSRVFFESDMPLTADDGDGTPFGYLDVFVYRTVAVTVDSFTYRIQDGTGTSAPARVTIDLTGTTSTEGTRYRGTRYQGTRYRGTRYRGTRYRGTRYRTLFDATLTTFAECGPRWVYVNPEITIFEQTNLQITAALYGADGERIATSNGFIADGDFFGDLGEPLSVEWPLWNAPVPAGGVYAQVFVKAVPADPNHAPYEITSNVVGCQT